jgi:hypothetical protein
MVRVVIRSVLLAAALLTGCAKSTVRSYESHACSTNKGDDPFLICSPSTDLVCINTYTVMVTDPKEKLKWDGGIRPVWVCRFVCTPGIGGCGTAGDVCCPGMIYGEDYKMMAACVPEQYCDTLGRDAAARDTQAPDTFRADTTGVALDSGTRDAGPVDAPASDSAAEDGP